MYKLASSTWGEEEPSELYAVIKSSNFTMGARVEEFEEASSRTFKSTHSTMVNSGSSANLVAMTALSIDRGFYSLDNQKEILVPAVSWSTTYYPINQANFKIKFVDIDPQTLNIDLQKARRSITSETVGIVGVNLLGNPAGLPGLRQLCDEYGLFLMEDNCESMGASIEGRYAGTWGDIGTFSTFFSHHISTMEGGFALTQDFELDQAMKSIRAHGWTRSMSRDSKYFSSPGDAWAEKFHFVMPGYNLRPLEMEAAVGIPQLRKLEKFLDARRENARRFAEVVSEFDFLRMQKVEGDSSWFGFALTLRGSATGRRGDLIRILDSFQIESRPVVTGNFVRNPVVGYLRTANSGYEDFPAADDVHDNGLYLGNHHYDLSSEFEILARALHRFSRESIS